MVRRLCSLSALFLLRRMSIRLSWRSNNQPDLLEGVVVMQNPTGEVMQNYALGCYAKSCRRSYHVPCAYEIADCRWDTNEFLMLCPTHASQKFPNESIPL